MPTSREHTSREERPGRPVGASRTVASARLHPGFGSAARLGTARSEPARIGGRRLGRTLGTGSTWAAVSTRSGRSPDPEEIREENQEEIREEVMLRPTTEASAVVVRGVAATLTALDHPHVLAVLDLAECADDGWCLFVERLDGGNLPDLLRRRVTIAPGEAVTILAPVVDALRHAHERGIVHGSVAAADIRFDRAGRPVLCGWGRLPTDPVADPRSDWRALATVVDAVLPAAGVEPDVERGELTSAAWVAEMIGVLTPEEFATAFEEQVFGFARPLPVLLDAERTEVSRAAIESSGLGMPRTWQDADFGERMALGHRRGLGERSERPAGRTRASVAAVPERLARLVAGMRTARASIVRGRSLSPSPGPGRGSSFGSAPGVDHPLPPDVGSSRRGARRRVSRTRRRAVVLGVAVAVVVSTAIVVTLPDAGTTPARQRQQQQGGASASETPATQAPGPATQGAQPNAGEDPLTGDDPLAATVELVRRRSACLAAADAACLAALSEPGSAADEAAREAAAGSAELGRAIDVDAGSVTLVSRQGDAAVCSATTTATPETTTAPETTAAPDTTTAPETTERQPVTILVMRTGTGWRLRELFGYGPS